MRLLWLLLPLAQLAAARPENATNDLLWGAYRPNLYFGLRPRLPQSLMTGLIWFGTHNYASISKARHACEQGDGLDSYTWTTLDPRQGGVQVLKDSQNNVELTTEFLKVPGGSHGGSWIARVKGKPMDPTIPSSISTIFYLGLEGLGGLDMITDEDEDGLEGPIEFAGSSPELDEFTVRIVDGSPNNQGVTSGPYSDVFADRIGKSHFFGLRVNNGDIWTAKDWILQNIVKRATEIVQPYQDNPPPPDPSFVLQLSDEVYSASNLYAVQKTFEGEFQFDVFYENGEAAGKLNSDVMDEGVSNLVSTFDQRFENVLPTSSAYPTAEPEALDAFSKAVTSNLLGGIGYFYGTSIVDKGFAYEWDQEDDDDSDEDEDDGGRPTSGARLTEPRALFTATPSRSFFPRGFYWDEGFHLLHIGQWDNDLSLEILKDWINLIDDNGWVAREQILGEEARSKVPAQFQTQVPTFANPPTLTMAVTAFIDRLKSQSNGPSAADLGLDFGTPGSQAAFKAEEEVTNGSKYLLHDHALEYLRSIYEPLKRHYNWFRRTQRGQIKQYGRKARSRTEAYRWRGRSEQHVLTSGMDDYPRGPPHAGELHLDLISWMGFFSRTMREISEFIGETDDAASYAEIEKAIIDNIDDLHWSEENQMYCDAGISSEDESEHICHKGYLSLFPFMLSLLPTDSPHLGPVLDLLRDPKELWSQYGIRSLSASHPEFGQGENYWKGPIWMQMNYMVLSSLHKTYAAQEGPHRERAQEIYTELRKNVVDNEYTRTGYVWEQYDSMTGEGRRSHPFTGWTSLVALSKHACHTRVADTNDTFAQSSQKATNLQSILGAMITPVYLIDGDSIHKE
ncbi:glycoside hydrolase family 63 protein [Coniophora puteana RWD-64-598 SS2]|uniref:Mannosyl-oligosaccharide glucosidase n=1 Tax=Coniophora puteana (strain RWD-64-598) TaxID=741705 RepID=A0A5M3N331_CONPW|nr:glycoside hydrolase family 63 protein [Coniophora puteana RWD-64-598 SS2]EIW85275.1 glycoside hydrolase family 63 protein [Coniophora puteana RWD-64-598 SS2]